MIRIAAVGDVHLAPDVRGRMRQHLDGIGEHADVLLLAGDLTQHGTVFEAEVVADEFADLDVPVVAVLGNHDYQSDRPGEMRLLRGHPEMKAFVRHPRELAEAMGEALRALDAGFRVALTHYSPVTETLAGEPPEIHAFLGSHFLAEAADSANADLCVHGHAHAGCECGTTPGGAPVRNVALPVLQRAYAV
jgi:Icc-related predicted phosphoesterase